MKIIINVIITITTITIIIIIKTIILRVSHHT